MKKLILIFIVISSISFGASYNVQEPKELSEAKMIEFEMEKKAPWGAVAGTFLLPSVGHAYAGDWGRGLKFLGGEMLAFMIANTAYGDLDENSNYMLGDIAIITLIGLRIWEHVDAYKTAKNYNTNLYRKLSLSPVVSVEDKSVGMQFSYNF